MFLHIADGAKGGVGKSATAQMLINYLSSNDQPIIVFETDTQIPDVGRGVSKSKRNITLLFADLRTDEGWQAMLATLQNLAQDDSTKDTHVVISLPGADLDIKHYTELVGLLIEALGITVWSWFVLNAQSDSVTLLKTSLKEGFASVASKKIAVKCGLHGKPETFTYFDASKERAKMDHIIYTEKMPAKDAARLKLETATIDEIAALEKAGRNGQKPDFLYSSNLTKWVRQVTKELNPIFDVIEVEK